MAHLSWTPRSGERRGERLEARWAAPLTSEPGEDCGSEPGSDGRREHRELRDAPASSQQTVALRRP